MPDLATATAAALAEQGRYVAVVGRDSTPLDPIGEAAERAIVAGPSTRLAIGAGLMSGGHRAVVVADGTLPLPSAAPGVLTVTDDAAVATAAVRHGWTVIQPWTRADVGGLLARAELPAVLFLGNPAAAPGQPGDDAPAPREVREWARGDLACLAASGPAVGAMRDLGERLHMRGVDIGLLEIAFLTHPEMEPLAGGGAVLVAGRGAAHAWRRGEWPTGRVDTVRLKGAAAADLVGAVLALVPVH